EDQNIIGAALRFAENYLDGICGAAERGRKSRASTKSDNTSTMEV
nr:NagC family transcriptional regulator [Bifidobacterium longum]